ncbi:MAG TPA: hypothetical protein PLK99_12735, partial [Burkholderiales bacterium]|nr:hypothetical protein [Burkholderiales bacterium]
MSGDSINQNLALPNFRNAGIMLRILLIVNVLCFLAAFLKSGSWTDLLGEWAEISAVSQPLLLSSLLVFALLDDWLHGFSYSIAAALLLLFEACLASIVHEFGAFLAYGSLLRY